MDNSSNTHQTLFGQPGRTSVWGIDFPSSLCEAGFMSIDLPKDHFVVIFQLKGTVRIGCGEGLNELDGDPGLIVAATGTEGGTLMADNGFSGLAIGFSMATIRSVLEPHRPGLDSSVREVVFSTNRSKPIKRAIASHFVEKWIPDLRHSPVSGPAAEFWYEGKVREFIALACFHDEQPGVGFFCSRQKVLAMDRVALVKNYLTNHIDENLDLEILAGHVGCSRHYLSRTFSESTGTTISQYLRRLRIERAADLLVSGKFNVSEVAVEVGYHSLSHFSKAFFQEKGCLPSKYDRRVA